MLRTLTLFHYMQANGARTGTGRLPNLIENHQVIRFYQLQSNAGMLISISKEYC